MARRQNKQNSFENLIELATKLPWWLSVLAALAAYLVLHHYATREISIAAVPGQIGQVVSAQLWKTFTMFGQYVLPAGFLLGALISAFRRRKRMHLVSQTQDRGEQSALLDMNWQEFEILVGEAFRLQGFKVTETGGGGADGGVDLMLTKGTEKFLVQCKQWKAYSVGVAIVRELYGVMAAQGAAGGFVVTSGKFTEDAVNFAKGRNISLIDGPKLFAMIQAARTKGDAKPTVISTPATNDNEQAPACPKCGGAMVKRTAKQGSMAGQEFWGCTGFPNCRGIVSIK